MQIPYFFCPGLNEILEYAQDNNQYSALKNIDSNESIPSLLRETLIYATLNAHGKWIEIVENETDEWGSQGYALMYPDILQHSEMLESFEEIKTIPYIKENPNHIELRDKVLRLLAASRIFQPGDEKMNQYYELVSEVTKDFSYSSAYEFSCYAEPIISSAEHDYISASEEYQSNPLIEKWRDQTVGNITFVVFHPPLTLLINEVRIDLTKVV